MTGQQILQSDVLDILFENRNKAYGAYRLRKTYPKELLKAIGITTVFVMALMFFGGSSQTKATIVSSGDGIIVRDVNVLKEKIEPPKPKPTPPPVQHVKQVVALDNIKPVQKPQTPPATQQQLDDAVPGATVVDGPPATSLQPPASPTTNTGSGNTETVVEKPEPPLPSRQPQFPGGTDAWLKFLSRNLTPPSDLEAGEKRSVLVRFSVDEEGVITNFQVVQSGGSDFDNEVIRVLKKMPRWLPAIQAGKPTAVSFTQPVTFQAAE